MLWTLGVLAATTVAAGAAAGVAVGGGGPRAGQLAAARDGAASTVMASDEAPRGEDAASSGRPRTASEVFAETSDGVARIDVFTCGGDYGSGSGFLVSDRLVATVAHVVAGLEEVVVEVDGATRGATVVGFAPDEELALLRLDSAVAGHVFRLTDRDATVGEPVLAIGYPLGGPLSLTQGAVSGVGRDLPFGDYYLEDLLQTDAALNPGNSGGPLLDERGAVLGLVEGGVEDAEGLAFAIPAASAARQFEQWRDETTAVDVGCGH